MSQIRPAGRDDAPAILALLRALAEELGEVRRFRLSEEAIRSQGFGERPLFRTTLAFAAAGPSGVAVSFPTFSTTRAAPGVYVQDLYVVAEARHAGLGRRLLGAVIRQAQAEWGAQYLMLMVYDTNHRARAFYAREGFGLADTERPAMLDGAAFQKLGQVA